jgi:hypothetical protein
MSDLPPITSKVGLDVTDLKTGLAEMNRDIRVIESAFKASVAGLEDWGKSATGLETRIKALNEQIEIQKRKVEALQGEYSRVANEQGAGSRAAEELAIKLNKEVEALGKMQRELNQSESGLRDLKEGSQDAAKGVDKLEEETQDSVSALEHLKKVASGLKTGLAIGVTAIAGLAAAVAGVGVAVGKMVTDSADMAGELTDLSLVSGISVERLQELAYVGDQVGTSAETMTGSLSRLTRSMAEAKDQAVDYQEKSIKAAADAAAQSAEISAKYVGKIEEQESRLSDLREDHGKRRIALESSLGESLLDIAKSIGQEAENLQERHTARMIDLRESINKVETDFEYERAERQEDVNRELSRLEEDYKHDREGLTKDLGAAETEAERARIQERIDELDYEFNTRKQRRLEDLEEDQSDAEHAKEEKLKALQAQLAEEEVEYEKQSQKIQAKQAEQEEAAKKRYRSELAAATERYNEEVAIATKALNDIQAAAQEASAEIKSPEMGDAAKAFQKLGISVVDANGELRDSEVVFSEALEALGGIENATERDALAMAIFGRSAMELNPLIKAGADEIANLSKEAHEMGAVMSEEDVAGLESFGDKLAGLKQGLAGTLGTLSSAFLPAFQGLADTAGIYLGRFSEIVKGADGDLVKMAEGVGDLIGDIANDIAKRAPEFLQAGLSIIQGILDAIIKNLPMLLEAAIEIIRSLVEFIVKNLPMIIDAGVEILLMLVNAIVENLPMLVEAGVKALISLIEGLAEAMPKLIPAIVDAIILITKILIDNLPLLVEAGGKLLIGIVEGIVEALPALIEAMPELIEAMVEALIILLPLLAEIGFELLKAIVKGIVENLPEIGTAIVKLGLVLAEIPGKIWNTVLQIGKDIVTGVWQGIVDNAAWFYDQVRGFFGNMLETARNTIEGHSPSRKFMELGKDSGVGYIQGLVNSLKDGQQAIGQAFGAMTQPAFAMAGGRAGAGNTTNVNYNFSLNANYPAQSAGTLAADVRLLQMLYGEA